MKIYGETIFDIAYLLIAVVVGIYILIKSKDKQGKLMGFSVLVLGCGDAFHLVPRMLEYFVSLDFTAALGIGKLITSITMTIFYLFMYCIYKNKYNIKDSKVIERSLWLLAILRICLCLLPQNNWITNNGSVAIGIIRNIPFLIIGFIIICLYYRKRKEDKVFKNIWIYILLSFLFYIPVVVGASTIPMLGMFMLPKTICYILIILTFKKSIKVEAKSE